LIRGVRAIAHDQDVNGDVLVLCSIHFNSSGRVRPVIRTEQYHVLQKWCLTPRIIGKLNVEGRMIL
jgi:hypothetical protein